MTDVKNLADDEALRAAHGLFRVSLHVKPADDAGWAFARTTFPPGRTFGGYVDGTLAGCTMSFPMHTTVPGGAALPTAAVTRVGVRADHTRRGVLSALMREQLAAVAADGEPLAALRASEYPIYGRFGYGVTSRGVDVQLDPRKVSLHPAAPRTGEVRMISKPEFGAVLPVVYERIGARRPGMFRRSQMWWHVGLDRPDDQRHVLAAVHTGADGDDGFVVYTLEENHEGDSPWGTAVQIEDLHAADAAATTALWRFVLGIDMINRVRAWQRPLDEPLHLLVADPREVATKGVFDELWLRVVDVPAALSARSWAGSDAMDDVVLGVRDALLPSNGGSYRITPDGVSRVDKAPQVECDVAVLGRLYLGDVAPSVLAATGWLTATDPAALRAADALFATGVTPWCGTFF